MTHFTGKLPGDLVFSRYEGIQEIVSASILFTESAPPTPAVSREVEDYSAFYTGQEFAAGLRAFGFLLRVESSRTAKEVMEQHFAPALGKLHQLLETASIELETPIRFALIGGLAVSTWGAIRSTRDIDLLADSNPNPIGDRYLRDQLKRFFEKKHCTVEWRVGDAEDPIPLMLRVHLRTKSREGAADILWAHKRWHQEALQRRIQVRSGTLRVFVLHPEDLILMKLDAGGPQDLLDVQALFSSRLPQVNIARLKRNAARLHLRKILDRCVHEAGKND